MTTYFVTPGMGGRSSLNSAAFDSISLGASTTDNTMVNDDTIQDLSMSMGGDILRMSQARRSSNGAVPGQIYHDYGEPQNSFENEYDERPEERPQPARISFGEGFQGLVDLLGIKNEVEC